MTPKFIIVTDKPTGDCVRISTRYIESYQVGGDTNHTIVRMLSTCAYEVTETPEQIDRMIEALADEGYVTSEEIRKAWDYEDEGPPPSPEPQLPYVEPFITTTNIPYHIFSRRIGDILRVRFKGPPLVEFDDIVLPLAGYYDVWVVKHTEHDCLRGSISGCKGGMITVVTRVV